MTLKEWLEEAREREAARDDARRGTRKAPGRGTQEWLAQTLGCDQGLVSKWVRRVTTPEIYGAAIVRLSRGKVTLPELMRVAPPPLAVLGEDGKRRTP